MNNPILKKGVTTIKVTNLNKILSEKIKGKSVLDVGCAGNIGEKSKWPKPATWLHGQCSQLARYCVGIDIDREELVLIHQMQPELRLVAMSGDAFHFKRKFDVVLFNWCFSYLNPYRALRCARQCLAEDGEIFIGVTNASTILNFKRVLIRRVPYPDEHGLFSWDPVFFINFLMREGFRIERMYWAERRKYSLFENIFVHLSPYLRQYFLVVVKPI